MDGLSEMRCLLDLRKILDGVNLRCHLQNLHAITHIHITDTSRQKGILTPNTNIICPSPNRPYLSLCTLLHISSFF